MHEDYSSGDLVTITITGRVIPDNEGQQALGTFRGAMDQPYLYVLDKETGFVSKIWVSNKPSVKKITEFHVGEVWKADRRDFVVVKNFSGDLTVICPERPGFLETTEDFLLRYPDAKKVYQAA